MSDSTVSWMFFTVVALAAIQAVSIYAIARVAITGQAGVLYERKPDRDEYHATTPSSISPRSLR